MPSIAWNGTISAWLGNLIDVHNKEAVLADFAILGVLWSQQALWNKHCPWQNIHPAGRRNCCNELDAAKRYRKKQSNDVEPDSRLFAFKRSVDIDGVH